MWVIVYVIYTDCNSFVSLLFLIRNQAEMAHTCRGTISLHGALIHTEDSCTFVISNGGTQTFHIKAANEVERQRWVTALELAIAKAIRAMESGRTILHINFSGLHCTWHFHFLGRSREWAVLNHHA